MTAARGLVVERGTLLSHTAVAGRLLGVPTVVAVAGATTRIPDGALVELDGGAGTVRILASRSGDSPRTVLPSNPVAPASTPDAPVGHQEPTRIPEPARHARRGAGTDSRHHTPSAAGMSVATNPRTGTPAEEAGP